MLLSTMEGLPGYRVVTHLGLVQGNVVRAKTTRADTRALFRTILAGGELRAYTEQMHEQRQQAVERMMAQARSLGAHAVLNVRFESNVMALSAVEILAYGSAVQIEPE